LRKSRRVSNFATEWQRSELWWRHGIRDSDLLVCFSLRKHAPPRAGFGREFQAPIAAVASGFNTARKQRRAATTHPNIKWHITWPRPARAPASAISFQQTFTVRWRCVLEALRLGREQEFSPPRVVVMIAHGQVRLKAESRRVIGAVHQVVERVTRCRHCAANGHLRSCTLRWSHRADWKSPSRSRWSCTDQLLCPLLLRLQPTHNDGKSAKLSASGRPAESKRWRVADALRLLGRPRLRGAPERGGLAAAVGASIAVASRLTWRPAWPAWF